MTDKKYYDIHALKFAHETCIRLAQQALDSGNTETAKALMEACDVFLSALKESDCGMEELRRELEKQEQEK